MRRKKHKQTRRAVSFFKINYGLHEPYKVLLDGNFIHACCTSNLGELDKHLQHLLGGKTQTYVTSCVMHELKSLGAEFRPSFLAAQKIKLHHCGHHRPNHRPQDGAKAAAGGEDEPAGEQQPAGEGKDQAAGGVQKQQPGPIAAADCILEQVGSSNQQHWWVASQDRKLREQLGKVAGMPIIFASVNGIHLETPSEMAKSCVKQEQEAGMALPQHERRSKALEDLEQIRPKLRTNVRFRKNKAKGPNPLASKKKIKRPEGPRAAKAPAAAGAQAEEAGKPKRRRKRARGAGAGQEAE